MNLYRNVLAQTVVRKQFDLAFKLTLNLIPFESRLKALK